MRQHIRAIAAAALAAVLGAGPTAAVAADWDDGDGWGHSQGWGHAGWGHGGWGHPGRGYGAGWGYRRGWDHGGAAAAAALGGFALGAVAGSVAHPPYGGCYPVRRPLVDGWGNVVGYRSVEVCE